MLTVDDVADETQTDADTVRLWIRTGQLTASNVCRSPLAKKPRWRIRRADLEQFLASRQNRPPAVPTPRQSRRSVTSNVREFF